MIAVAYWGNGAVEQTGIAQRGKGSTRVLCDLFSGACNPDEIATLLGTGTEVRTLRGMHAKVWASGSHVIVGSANASMNGLGFEADSSSTPNVEAAVQFRDPAVAGEVRGWFERVWDLAMPVNDEVLTDARQLWRRKQDLGRVSAAIMEHRILAYCQDNYSEQALNDWNANQETLYTQKERKKFKEQGIEPFYEMGPEWAQIPSRGTVILDFSCRKQHQRFKFCGFLEDKARSSKAR